MWVLAGCGIYDVMPDEKYLWKQFEAYFDSLSEQFVLKATHDSRSYVVVPNKGKMDKKTVRYTLENALKRNYL